MVNENGLDVLSNTGLAVVSEFTFVVEEPNIGAPVPNAYVVTVVAGVVVFVWVPKLLENTGSVVPVLPLNELGLINPGTSFFVPPPNMFFPEFKLNSVSAVDAPNIDVDDVNAGVMKGDDAVDVVCAWQVAGLQIFRFSTSRALCVLVTDCCGSLAAY